MIEKVILVNDNDQEIGEEEKLKAHQEGKRHRAFSIFVFNKNQELLLQKRNKSKYHCGGLWSNACCGHPRPKEDLEKAAHRRLQEEMGFDCPLKRIFCFNYEASFENGLTEAECDHVFIGTFNNDPKPDPKEAEAWKWISKKELENDIKQNPDNYTVWFKKILTQLEINKKSTPS